ncbi:MAG: hypothetical protein IIB36_09190 [Gemmatimonadetes bacterium]|nr:hypothetical protein [Chloroflexota bacterium]MCH7531914.1 hypothetical protein [Gemmatimonadota bacterium]
MPATRKLERELARLRARLERRSQQLADVGFMLKGSLVHRFKRCSSPGCHCHAEPPRLHGPYWQWSAKVKGKTVTRVLSEDQLGRYREWMDNAQRFEEVVQNLFELSAEADAIVRSLERQAPEREPREDGASRPPARARS